MNKTLVKGLLTILLILPLSVFARNVELNNGILISEEQYNNLSKIYADDYIKSLSQDDLDRILNMGLDFDNLNYSTRYIKSVHNSVNNTTFEMEISKEEFDSFTPSSTRGFIETNAKRTTLSFTKVATNFAYASLTTQWKTMPTTRSFDVSAMRYHNVSEVDGTQAGRQTFTLNGEIDYVQYSYMGSNMNNITGGFGISMNLVNSNITSLSCTIDETLSINTYPAVTYGSYQHATSDVTLAQSKSYTLDPGGLGGVILFNSNSISNKYDGMSGLYVSIAS